MRLTVNECFSGIGSQHAGLERLKIEFEITSTSEVDKDVIVSYAAIHCGLTSDLINSYNYPTGKEMTQYLTDRNIGFDFKKMKPYDWFKIIGRKSKALEKYYLACILSKNVGDISKIEKLDYADFWTYSFPCQDISVAGKGKGIKENTRSGLLYQVDRLLEIARDREELPQYLMLENVKNLVGKKFKPQFDEWLQKLDKLGYNTYWQVSNSKNYGVPQNRERVFAISIRKNIDIDYIFPEPFDNGKRLKDILETKVDKKYYLSDEKVRLFLKQGNVNPSGKGINGNVCTNDICNTLTTNKGEGPKIAIKNEIDQIGLLDIKGNEQVRRVYADTGISPTLNTMQGGNRQPKILEVGKLNGERHSSAQNSVLDIIGICPALDTMQGGNRQPKVLIPQKTAKDSDMKIGIDKSVNCPKKIEYANCLTAREDRGISNRKSEGTAILELPCIVASRGRNPENPSDRTTGAPTEQRIEFNKNGTSNTITTVQKDNYVVEPNVLTPKRTNYGKTIRKDYENGLISESRHNMTKMEPREDGICNTLTTVQKDNYLATTDFRIRKLTPLECFRLMGFTDEQFYKAAKFNSNSQLYKQAGNSIVVDVLYYLFKNLFTDKPQNGEIEIDLRNQITIEDWLGV